MSCEKKKLSQREPLVRYGMPSADPLDVCDAQKDCASSTWRSSSVSCKCSAQRFLSWVLPIFLKCFDCSCEAVLTNIGFERGLYIGVKGRSLSGARAYRRPIHAIIFNFYLLIFPQLGLDDELVLLDEELREVLLRAVRRQSHTPPTIHGHRPAGDHRSMDPGIVEDEQGVVFLKAK